MKYLILITLLILATSPVFGITHLQSTVNTSSATTTGCSFTHAGGTSPTLAVLAVMVDGNITISGTPTYGGANMTFLTNSDSEPCDAASDQRVYLYYLVSPSGGNQTATANFVDSDDHHTCIAVTFSGTSTSDPIPEYNILCENSAAGLPQSATTVNVTDADNWVMTFSSWDGQDVWDAATLSVSGCTMRNLGETGTSNNTDDSYFQCDSTDGTGNITHTINPAISDEAGTVTIEINDANIGSARRRMF